MYAFKCCSPFYPIQSNLNVIGYQHARTEYACPSIPSSAQNSPLASEPKLGESRATGSENSELAKFLVRPIRTTLSVSFY